jgi:glucose-6-phosphate isomerase
MSKLSIDISKVLGFVPETKINSYESAIKEHQKKLHEKTGAGSDFLGWVNLPSSISQTHLKDIEEKAASLRKKVRILVVIGIGGSYLGSKAVIDALSHNFPLLKKDADDAVVVFAGQNLGEDYLSELLEVLNDNSYGIAVISKSGTTTEPAVAFRILKAHLEEKVGKEEAKNLIVAITDEKKGALRKLADIEGYKTFVIPDDTGGRFSVLTPVGLLPIAFAGFDIKKLVKGAVEMEKISGMSTPFSNNPVAIYAATRNALYESGKKVEILANYNNKLVYLSEWWKQLYGESEGKEGKGIFPASVNFTADLHSMGQYIQEGERHIFETVISIKNTNRKLTIPTDPDNLDQLNFLTGKRIDEVNKMAELGTMLAHIDGGVPNIKIELSDISEESIGELIYFFEKACGISGYILGLNPFDQPGVEAYKKNMFALLEKPGFEEDTKRIKGRL